MTALEAGVWVKTAKEGSVDVHGRAKEIGEVDAAIDIARRKREANRDQENRYHARKREDLRSDIDWRSRPAERILYGHETDRDLRRP